MKSRKDMESVITLELLPPLKIRLMPLARSSVKIFLKAIFLLEVESVLVIKTKLRSMSVLFYLFIN